MKCVCVVQQYRRNVNARETSADKNPQLQHVRICRIAGCLFQVFFKHSCSFSLFEDVVIGKLETCLHRELSVHAAAEYIIYLEEKLQVPQDSSVSDARSRCGFPSETAES